MPGDAAPSFDRDAASTDGPLAAPEGRWSSRSGEVPPEPHPVSAHDATCAATPTAALDDELRHDLGTTMSRDSEELRWLMRLNEAAAADAAEVSRALAEERLGALVDRVTASTGEEFAIYGAGDAGRWIASRCVARGRRPRAFILSDSSRAGSVENDLPVWTPEQARARGVTSIVLGTLASGQAMRARLQEAFGDHADALSILECPPTRGLPSAGRSTLELLKRATAVVRAGRSVAEFLWLERNAMERLDAGVPVNPAVRRAFHLDRYRFAAQYTAGARVLDCACGTGYGAYWVGAGGNASSVLGVDLNADAVAYASRHYVRDNVRFDVGDASALHDVTPADIDVVTSFETIEHVPDDDAMLSEFRRVLRPGGVLIVSTPNDWPVEASPFHVRTYDEVAFRALLLEYFNEVQMLGQWPATGSEPGRIAEISEPCQPAPECLVAVCRL